MWKLTTILAGLLLSVSAFAQVNDEVVDAKKINKTKMDAQENLTSNHGTIRAKYEYQTATDESRFQVRNARFSLTGNVLPIVAYKAEIDLSDQGKIRMLDAYTRIFPIKHVNFTIGQMRVPFTIDAHRSPHVRYFANRSFIGKQVGDVRDVGATVAYTRKDAVLPFILEGGLFNGSGLTEQKEWQKTLNYSLKGQFWFAKGWNLTLSTQMMKPAEVRVNMYDAGIYYETDRFHIEAEYLYKTYGHDSFKNMHSINSFAVYDIPLPKFFHKMSFLARYDMMTDHSDGIVMSETESGKLAITDYARHRLTGGLTFSFSKSFVADIRLNYEKYFYKKSA